MIEAIGSRLPAAAPARATAPPSDPLVAGRSEQTRHMAIRAMEAEAYAKYAGALQFFKDADTSAAQPSAPGVSAVLKAYSEF